MTDEQLARLIGKAHEPLRCTVTGDDYSYEGKLLVAFYKDNPGSVQPGPPRCVVQDQNRRLFIHNAAQVTLQ